MTTEGPLDIAQILDASVVIFNALAPLILAVFAVGFAVSIAMRIRRLVRSDAFAAPPKSLDGAIPEEKPKNSEKRKNSDPYGFVMYLPTPEDEVAQVVPPSVEGKGRAK